MTTQEAKNIVLNKFASTNSRANHVLPLRTLRFGVLQRLSREDRQIFLDGVNELIRDGIITYEPPQDGLEVLRLTQTGYNQLYKARDINVLKEDIMGVFRNQGINPNEVIPMRYFIHSYIPTLNPKDQDQFTQACNALIDEGKLHYEDGSDGGLKCLRLLHY